MILYIKKYIYNQKKEPFKSMNTINEETILFHKKKGITGSTLKLIAIISMLIDHMAAVVSLSGSMTFDISSNHRLYLIYSSMRLIGRIAFPIFCFLLVEGFLHTHNIKKYAMRLFAFCIISEIPFDLAFQNQVVNWNSQNVFFTLFLGLLVLIGFNYMDKPKEQLQQNTLSVLLYSYPIFFKIVIVVLGIITATLLKTDYAGFGVFLIVLLYLYRFNRKNQMVLGAISTCWELTAPISFLLIYFYNGKRGLSLRYVFYFFYPVHLLLLYSIVKVVF